LEDDHGAPSALFHLESYVAACGVIAVLPFVGGGTKGAGHNAAGTHYRNSVGQQFGAPDAEEVHNSSFAGSPVVEAPEAPLSLPSPYLPAEVLREPILLQ
jgi:hypothetical protein